MENRRLSILNIELFKTLIIILVLYVVFNFLIISIKIDGSSMYPTLDDGEKGIMLRTNFINKPHENDIVVFNGENTYGKKELIIKRIIAAGGDTVRIDNNDVIVNNKIIDDSYRNEDTQMDNMNQMKVPEGYYFVLGDNRNNSRDSRMVGLIEGSDIIAVNGIIFWPFNKITILK